MASLTGHPGVDLEHAPEGVPDRRPPNRPTEAGSRSSHTARPLDRVRVVAPCADQPVRFGRPPEATPVRRVPSSIGAGSSRQHPRADRPAAPAVSPSGACDTRSVVSEERSAHAGCRRACDADRVPTGSGRSLPKGNLRGCIGLQHPPARPAPADLRRHPNLTRRTSPNDSGTRRQLSRHQPRPALAASPTTTTNLQLRPAPEGDPERRPPTLQAADHREGDLAR